MHLHIQALLGMALLIGLPAYGADAAKPKEDDRQTVIEIHEKMAERHRVASSCLKANRPVADCNREAMKECPMMKSGMCPFMGAGGMMGGGEKKKGMHERMKGMDHGDDRRKK